MRLTNKFQAHVNFANFCIAYGFNPYNAGKLCQLVQQRANFAMNDMNVHHDQESQAKADKKDDRLMNNVREMAKGMGLEVTFPSSYASVTKDGKSINLPL